METPSFIISSNGVDLQLSFVLLPGSQLLILAQYVADFAFYYWKALRFTESQPQEILLLMSQSLLKMVLVDDEQGGW